MRSLLLGLVCFSFSCFSPKYSNDGLTCEAGAHPCPSGYHCAFGNTCYKNGTDPTVKHKGEPCGPGDLCETMQCVDGVCCDSKCDGACQTCSATPGTCTAVTGTPAEGRSCNGTGTLCGGSCDGTSAGCTYPSTAAFCGASCDGHCDGNGSCSTGSAGSCPNGYACGATGCLTACNQNSDCQTYFACSNHQCQRLPESDCLDGKDNNGDGLIDCADPTCIDTKVMCAPAVSASIGYLSDVGCDVGFNATHLNKDLTVPTQCSGCGCTVASHCSYVLYGDQSGAGCFNQTFQMTGAITGTGYATLAASKVAYSISVAPSSVLDSCKPAGNGTPLPTHYATTKNFCAASVSTTSAGCNADQVCVAKPAAAAGLCALVSGSSCPTGFDKSATTYYRDGTVPDTRACTCNGCGSSSPGSCAGRIAFQAWTDQACLGDGSDCHVCPAATCCATFKNSRDNYYWATYDRSFGGDHPVTTLYVSSVETPSAPTCTGTGTVTVGAANPDPVLAAQVCCQ